MRILIIALALLGHAAMANPSDPADRAGAESKEARCVMGYRIVQERVGHPGKGIVTVRREPRIGTDCQGKVENSPRRPA